MRFRAFNPIIKILDWIFREPSEGAQRTATRFLWLPKHCDDANQWVWMERVTYIETWTVGGLIDYWHTSIQPPHGDKTP